MAQNFVTLQSAATSTGYNCFRVDITGDRKLESTM